MWQVWWQRWESPGVLLARLPEVWICGEREV